MAGKIVPTAHTTISAATSAGLVTVADSTKFFPKAFVWLSGVAGGDAAQPHESLGEELGGVRNGDEAGGGRRADGRVGCGNDFACHVGSLLVRRLPLEAVPGVHQVRQAGMGGCVVAVRMLLLEDGSGLGP